jgi:hypothetical protein
LGGSEARTCAPVRSPRADAEPELAARQPSRARHHTFRYIDMRKTLATLCFALVALSTSVHAQTWTSEQQDLWKLEDMQWKMSAAKDLTWIPKMVHASMSGWDNDSPAPLNLASMTKWSRFNSGEGSTLQWEIYPVAATITGNVAVMQYTYRSVTENYKKERKASNGRWTDVLVKDGSGWKFITWAGGADPSPTSN